MPPSLRHQRPRFPLRSEPSVGTPSLPFHRFFLTGRNSNKSLFRNSRFVRPLQHNKSLAEISRGVLGNEVGSAGLNPKGKTAQRPRCLSGFVELRCVSFPVRNIGRTQTARAIRARPRLRDGVVDPDAVSGESSLTSNTGRADVSAARRRNLSRSLPLASNFANGPVWAVFAHWGNCAGPIEMLTRTPDRQDARGPGRSSCAGRGSSGSLVDLRPRCQQTVGIGSPPPTRGGRGCCSTASDKCCW
jgi:hypothetical protein